MTADQTLTFLQITIGALIAFLGYRELRDKNKGDAFSSLMSAIQTSGQTIGDLMKMIAELPELRKQLFEALNKVSALEDESNDWKKERQAWKMGIGILLAQLVKLDVVPDWLPAGVTIESIVPVEKGAKLETVTTIRVIGDIP
jgi:hypothetical protein